MRAPLLTAVICALWLGAWGLAQHHAAPAPKAPEMTLGSR
jgi:hypothetical protein